MTELSLALVPVHSAREFVSSRESTSARLRSRSSKRSLRLRSLLCATPWRSV